MTTTEILEFFGDVAEQLRELQHLAGLIPCRRCATASSLFFDPRSDIRPRDGEKQTPHDRRCLVGRVERFRDQVAIKKATHSDIVSSVAARLIPALDEPRPEITFQHGGHAIRVRHEDGEVKVHRKIDGDRWYALGYRNRGGRVVYLVNARIAVVDMALARWDASDEAKKTEAKS